MLLKARELQIATVFAAITYAVASVALFGDPFKPAEALLYWTGILGSRYWLTPLLVGLAVGVVLALLTALTRARIFAPAVLVAVAMPMAVALTVLAVNAERAREIAKFRPDRIKDRSFRLALLERPGREPQFYVHAVAMKDCVPYIWSYRLMRFYQLEPQPVGVRSSFVPDCWIAYCDQLGYLPTDRCRP
jgi:hypothetical protein